MRQLGHDLRQAARLFVRRPAVSALVVVTLGLGLAATTIAFSLADAILWHPLPFPHADRLVRIRASIPTGAAGANLNALPALDQFFDGIYPFGMDSGIVSVGGDVQGVTIATLSPGLLGAIGVTPAWGRDFEIAETRRGSGVIIVSAELWRRILANNTATPATEQTVLLEGVRQTVVGVVPNGFGFPVGRVALWRPYIPAAATTRLVAIGRLKPGVTIESAQALARTTSSAPGASSPTGLVRDVQVVPFVVVNPTTSTALRVVLGAATLLLLIAVANTANVLLADTVRRDAEMAIRASLGASWLRLTRQVLTETLLVTAVAVGVALVVSSWAITALVKTVPYVIAFQALRPIALDWRALSFASLVAVFTAIGASALSILHAKRVNGQTALRGQTSGLRGQARARSALTAAQIAVTFALLAGASVLAGTLVRLSRIDPGFNPAHVVDVVVQMPSWRFTDDAQAETALEGVRADAARLPDVIDATLSNAMPPSLGSVALEDLTTGDGAARLGTGEVSVGRIDATFFSTLGIPLIEGRGIDARDRPGSQPAAVVSRALAERLAPRGDAIGRRFRESKSAPWLTVVGIVGDITSGDEGQAWDHLAFYTPRTQAPTWWYEGLIVKTRPMPEQIVPELRAVFHRAMPDAPVIEVTTAEAGLASSNARVRFATMLMTSCAGVAFALALIGVYGAFWCAVRQRTREMGIRLALGAAPSDVLRLVLGWGARLAMVGIVAGLPLALVATRSLRSLLYGVSANDPATFFVVAIGLAGAGVAATYLPARYASRIDPVSVIRQ
jgi:putative ABC transport system permease protein